MTYETWMRLDHNSWGTSPLNWLSGAKITDTASCECTARSVYAPDDWIV